MTKDKQIILLTGCSSGIGFELVRVLASKPSNVIYATTHQITDELEQLSCDNVIVRKMDMTKEEDIDHVTEEILKTEKTVDVLVHAEDLTNIKPVEKVTVDDAKQIMNSNVIGFTYIVSKILPTMKKNVQGHIIALSSVAGTIGIPFNSLYSASKFALEGYCESLQDELKDFYISVSLIECGPVSSTMDSCQQQLEETGKSEKKEDEDEDNALYEAYKQKTEAFYQTMSQTSEEIAKQIYTVIETPKNGQLRYETNKIYTNALCCVFKEDSSL